MIEINQAKLQAVSYDTITKTEVMLIFGEKNPEFITVK